MKTLIEAQKATVYFVNEDLEVEETTEAEFINQSIDETTSPRGVEPRLHVRENEDDNTFEVWTWGVRGNNPQFLEEFETEEEADNFIFQKTYEYDFMEDDQRDIWYSEDKEEAQALANERKAEL